MPFFVVINEQGPGWENGVQMRSQRGWSDRAAFMDRLEAERFVVLGGPLKYQKHRAMLVVNASDERILREKLATDPWMRTGVLRNIEVYPWEILLGKL